MPRKPRSEMTPEQRERDRAQKRAWNAANQEKVSANNKAYRQRWPERQQYASDVTSAWERLKRETAAAEASAARRAEALERLVQVDLAELYERIVRSVPRRLHPADQAEAASILFLPIMDGLRPVDFDGADVESAVAEMDRFNMPLRNVSLESPFGSSNRGQALGIYT